MQAGQFNIQQKFRDGFDPDRLVKAFGEAIQQERKRRMLQDYRDGWRPFTMDLYVARQYHDYSDEQWGRALRSPFGSFCARFIR